MRVMYDVLRDGLRSINTAAEQMAEARHQVSSGKRMLVASDDPLSTQLAVGEHATLGNIDAYRRSANSAAARLAATDSVMTSIVDKITAAIVAGTSARGSEADPDARAATVQAIQGLRDSLVGRLQRGSSTAARSSPVPRRIRRRSLVRPAPGRTTATRRPFSCRSIRAVSSR